MAKPAAHHLIRHQCPLRALFVAIIIFAAGCASNPAANTSSGGSGFTPLAGPEDPAALQAIAEAKLHIASSKRSVQSYRDARRSLRPYLDTSPAAAAYYIDFLIGEQTFYNDSAYVADRNAAIETLIRSGRSELLAEYWQKVDSREAFYSEAWALDAMSWYARNRATSTGGRYSQQQLAHYWSLGCRASVWNMDNDVNLFSLLLDPIFPEHCKPNLSLAGEFFTLYLMGEKGSSPSPNRVAEAVNLASQLGDLFFRIKDFPTAAGWYVTVIRLGTQNPNAYSQSEMRQIFESLYFPGWEFRVNGQILTVGQMQIHAMHGAQYNHQARIGTAMRHLQLIQDAGVTQTKSH